MCKGALREVSGGLLRQLIQYCGYRSLTTI